MATKKTKTKAKGVENAKLKEEQEAVKDQECLKEVQAILKKYGRDFYAVNKPVIQLVRIDDEQNNSSAS